MNETFQLEHSASTVETWLRSIAASDVDDRVRGPFQQVVDILHSQAEAKRGLDRPFLTVVMRTQGRKLEALQDALLTLFGQTDQDFELLLIPHNVDAASLSALEAIVERQASSFRSRIRVVPVAGGGRSRPLNEALRVGEGQYFAFFDDDDLVFGNWVEAFHTQAVQNPGRLLRAITSTQRMEQETWSGEVAGFRSVTWPKAEYPRSFEVEHHLERNHTPFMSVAFPRELFDFWGEKFDEELEVCEDWDMILRGVFLLGIEPVDELTAVYRLWTGITSSYTEHDRASWHASEERVRRKLNSRPLILPEGAPASIAASIRESEIRVSSDTRLNAVLTSSSWRVTSPLRAATRAARRVFRRLRSLRGKSEL